MALALVKLKKRRAGKTFEFLDYISYDVANISGVEIQGEEHNKNEWSTMEVLKVYGNS